MTHDPSEYIRGLQQLLISDKKKIGFLFGAGTSMAKKNTKSVSIPAIRVMTQEIECELSKNNEEYKTAINEIKQEIGEKYTVETFLSNVEQKNQIIGNGKLNGLNKSQFEDLKNKIKDSIKKRVYVIEREMNNSIHADFASWIAKADKKHGVEIFTTNYDYLFELGLENINIPYYDGFSGSYQPFFDSSSIENMNFLPEQTKLWKIHGSLGWHFNADTKKVWRKDSDYSDILIYPSILKYAESHKQPYIALGDRLTNFLRQPDTVLITCGYSFGDEHINDRILTALKSNPSTHVCILYYDLVLDQHGKRDGYLLNKDSHVTQLSKQNGKISVFGCRHAIIGCQFGAWKLKREPDKNDSIRVSLYFDEDGPLYADSMELKKELKGNEQWSGEGELTIPDFCKFVEFLQEMIPISDIKFSGSTF